ncbi:MAG: formylglycine-generating enzyme family protein [Candidatus Poribacteria bacterium]|nr:formylglycine-generating enzyme family protein [Candidatus Poribacteria bacterium]
MKPRINLLGRCCIVVVLLIGLIGCGEDAVEEDPVEFVQAIPASGSEIQPDATIVASFDSTPTGVQVTGAKFSVSGANVTITGPFTAGALNLVITWSDGAASLAYNVQAPVEAGDTSDPSEPNTPAPPPEGMVLIPAGEFDMGSNDAEARNDEQPVRRVYIDAFYMDETEVTNLQFKEFLLENPRWQKGRVDAQFAPGNYLHLWNGNNYPQGKANHPVTYVSWYAAMAYSEWAGKRLPTEAEREYAARGGLKGKKYPNGNTLTARDANFGNNVDDTTPVGRYPANGYGLYDMAGNVWEWCLDEYDAEFYFTFPRNGVARNPLSGANNVAWILNNWTNVKSMRSMRDGGWHYVAQNSRVSARSAWPPDTHGNPCGFRCVKDVAP